MVASSRSRRSAGFITGTSDRPPDQNARIALTSLDPRSLKELMTATGPSATARDSRKQTSAARPTEPPACPKATVASEFDEIEFLVAVSLRRCGVTQT
jgi:hypothetical protein